MPDEEPISDTTLAGASSAPDRNTSQSDNLKLQPQQPQGYQKLADFMSDYPAGACFRQFGSLNALNLLYYQAELCFLEKQLKSASEKDRASQDHYRRMYFQSHQWLSQGRAEGGDLDPKERTQWNLVLHIRETLREYSMSHHSSKYVQVLIFWR